MGNGLAKCIHCLTTGNHRRRRRRRHDTAAVVSEPYLSDEGLGHSFCYVRPEPSHLSSSKVHHHEENTASATSSATTTTSSSATTFRSISGASVSANTSTTPLSDFPSASAIAAAFDCSDSFASVPLQPMPRLLSGPLSGPLERGFMSGSIERGFMSGPIDPRAGMATGIFSGPLDHHKTTNRFFQRSFSHGGTTKASVIRGLRRVIARTISLGQNSIVAPIKPAKESDVVENDTTGASSSGREQSVDSEDGFDGQNLQWAQGKAGEDRVHVVISEEHGWVFVGIYDGFNGPDAPDYLLSNLYPSVQRELKGLLWEDKLYGTDHPSPVSSPGNDRNDDTAIAVDRPGVAATKGKSSKNKSTGAAKKWQENQRRWKSEWDKERLELDRKLKEQLANSAAVAEGTVNHAEVLKALSQALRKTEESFLDVADNMVSENPELALMGSCVLVMLMKGEDVYLMNVGDSRAVLARKPEPDVWSSIGRERQDLERINEEECCCDQDEMDGFPCLAAIQLTLDHSTSIEEEVQRIWKEHPDDSSAVTNDRVKGSLKVTRAFGAGFLKQPKWNDALLEMFQIDYVGTSPYITCNPSLWHHKLDLRDQFLMLSSDGLYQYFTNEEAVAEVELFIAAYPDGDPAQHLVEEVLFRAARKAGMDFHELLEIPRGDRRRYHDDVSIIVISLEGRIWRSSV